MRNKMIIMLLFAFVICLTGCGSKEEIPQGPVEVSVLINSEKDDIEEESLEDESEVVLKHQSNLTVWMRSKQPALIAA